MVDASDLGAIEEDVYVEGGGGTFDSEGADELILAFETMADDIESQRPSRQTAFEGALLDWHGAARDQFGERHTVGMNDASELATALRDAAADVRAMKTAAQQEQARIEKAREWVEAYEENERNESVLNKVSDWGIFGGEDFDPPPKPGPPTVPPNPAPAAPGLARQV
jgi:hypothetical protein